MDKISELDWEANSKIGCTTRLSEVGVEAAAVVAPNADALFYGKSTEPPKAAKPKTTYRLACLECDLSLALTAKDVKRFAEGQDTPIHCDSEMEVSTSTSD